MRSIAFVLFALLAHRANAHSLSRRLYEDLFTGYNQLIRPVKNETEKMTVKISLKLTQLLEINTKLQVMSTNVWIDQKWHDYQLTWDPGKYDGIDFINVPAESIWQPDIVLFNNADGKYEPTKITKALVRNTGEVKWTPPALYKSYCEINVEWFPFDVQSCLMVFSSWTYTGREVDLRHSLQNESSRRVTNGIDLSDFYKSVEWDILADSAIYDVSDCCSKPQITFNITMRRKTLFYTVNLIIPVVGISFLTLLVFCLPSDSGEKVTLAISILISLTVFFLLLVEIIPASSLVVPLLGKYLLFTLILITLSICVTVGVINVHFRSPSTHVMAPWVRHLFTELLPRLLCMQRPTSHDLAEDLAAISGSKRVTFSYDGQWNLSRASGERIIARNSCHHKNHRTTYHFCGSTIDNENLATFPMGCTSDRSNVNRMDPILGYFQDMDWLRVKERPYEFGIDQCASTLGQCFTHQSHHQPNVPCVGHECNLAAGEGLFQPLSYLLSSSPRNQYSDDVQRAIESILYIADHLKKQDEEHNIVEDWKYVAMVLDRLFLYIFSISCIAGTCIIILQAPSIYM
ncbi:acetylcholine receptor subunit alpha-like [Brevipalpus obovatus]|uniref:acetylcholine receptor subunit alpha-like n=1 Tax=Brevipalpus obovatus TaxID=246614 RepID=UPI003D9EEF46